MIKKNNEKRKWYFLIATALIVGAIVGYFATNSLTTKGEATKLISKNDAQDLESFYSGLLLNREIKCGCFDGSHSFDCCPEVSKKILKKYEEEQSTRLISYNDCIANDGVPVFDYPNGTGPPNYILCLARESGYLLRMSNDK